MDPTDASADLARGLNLERFARLNRENYATGMEQIRVLAVFMPMVEVMAAVAVALVVWYGGGEVLRGSLTLGVAIAVLTAGTTFALDAPPEVLFALAAVMVAQLALFGYLLPAYSVAGRRVQDHIEGLRYYLGVAEKDDLARLKAPEQTPQEFAKFLPYALALGVEKTWADRFAAVLGAAAVSAAVADYYVSEHGVGAFQVARLKRVPAFRQAGPRARVADAGRRGRVDVVGVFHRA